MSGSIGQESTVDITWMQNLMARQRVFYASGQTKDAGFRRENLRKLKRVIADHEQDILDALRADLNKSVFEGYLSEIGVVYSELNHAIKHVRSWAKPQRVRTPLTHFGSSSYIYQEPYGVALIISPWNYPIFLTFGPLIGAIAAGNCAVIKPSELGPTTSRVIARIINENFAEEYLHVLEGDVEVSTALLNQRFDYIFFTGSVGVGKVVMQAAAQNLTPVTLELGGKSPCIVHADANLKLAAKRIVWGKCLNAGQTCVAPDYLMVHSSVKAELFQYVGKYVEEFYGADVMENPDYPKIINERHYQRLLRLLETGHIVLGGERDDSRLVISPTVIDGVTWDDPVMQEEIFGPVLPVLEYESLTDAIDKVNARPRPLALYVFSESKAVQETVLRSVSFGGGCVNDTIYHISTPNLPFGGVGDSGIGGYHGKASFDVFSHEKSVLKQTTRFDIPLRYPSTRNAYKLVKMFFK